MSTTTDVNRALAYSYLLRAALLPLTAAVVVLLSALVGLIYVANAISWWWLLFLIPLSGVLLMAILVVSLGYTALNAIKPRKLTRAERTAVKEFIDYANSQLAEAGSLRGGPFGIIYGILKRKYRQGLNLSEAVIQPLRDAPKLKDRYRQLVRAFDRVAVQNAADQ